MRAFEYVIQNSDKSSEQLATDIISMPKEFSSLFTKAAERIVSNIVDKYHKGIYSDGLNKKWNNLFSEEERDYFKDANPNNRYSHIMIVMDKFPIEKLTFSVKVIRNATTHYLQDIKASGLLETLRAEELEILNKISSKQSTTNLTQKELRDYELWKAGHLQCEIFQSGR